MEGPTVYEYVSDMEDFYRMQIGYLASVVVFSASWCRPCASLKEWLNENYKDFPYPILIADVDNSELQPLTESIAGMPTIEIYQDSVRTHVIEGFQPDKLKLILDQFRSNDRTPISFNE